MLGNVGVRVTHPVAVSEIPVFGRCFAYTL